MIRLRSTLPLAVLAAGCAGQGVEGAWRGPFPLAPGKPCELRLNGNGTAAVECGGTAVVGAGRYRWDGKTLEIELRALALESRKAPPPEPYLFQVEGHGNTLKAAYGGEIYEWTRKPY